MDGNSEEPPHKKLKKVHENADKYSSSRTVLPAVQTLDSDLFGSLPTELQARILTYIPFQHQVQLFRVCKRWSRMLPGAITELNLRSLGRRIQDEELVSLLNKFAAVRKLDLRSCYQLTLSGTQHLTKLKALQFLDVGYSGLKSVVLDVVTHLTQLRTLKLARCQFTTSLLKNISVRLTGLEHLNLNWPVEGITDTSVQCLSLLTNLKYLNLSWCEQISDKGVMSLSTLTALQVLKLSHCANVTNRTLDFITRSFHSLRVLYLQNTAVNDEGVRDYLPRLSQLTAISLGGKSLTDNALLYLPLLRNVKRVVIGGPNFTSNAVLNLLKSVGAELEYLKIWQTDITDDVIEQIALARQLTKLNLDGCELITDRGISYLTGHKTLTYLSLFGCTQVTDRGPRAISHDKLKVVR